MKVMRLFLVGGALFAWMVVMVWLASCATISRWDAQLKAAHECRRRLCDGVLVSKELYTRQYVYYCCEDKALNGCHIADDKCDIEL